MATSLGSWDQDGENKILLFRKHVSKSLPKQDMQMFLNLPSYTLKKVFKMPKQRRSRILWQNTTTLQQDSTVAEFCGKMQHRYSRIVPQQNPVAKCNIVIAGQYRSRILWQNIAATLQQDNAVAEFCGRIQQRYNRTVPQQNSVAKCSNVTAGQYRSIILSQNVVALQQDSTVAEICSKKQQC